MDKIKSYWVDCSKCGKLLEVGSSKAVSAICSRCTHLGCIALMSEEQVNELFGKHKIAKPAGWHFMAEFVAEDGKVYHKGKEQPTLEGTLSPSKVKKNKIIVLGFNIILIFKI